MAELSYEEELRYNRQIIQRENQQQTRQANKVE